MKSVGVSEAKSRLSQLLREVESGETISVTRHGVEIARVIPVPKSKAQVQGAIDDWLAFRAKAGISLGDLTYRELIDEGRGDSRIT